MRVSAALQRSYHTARHSVKQIWNLKLEVLFHPPYSLDLAPRDFHVFWLLEDALYGRHFRTEGR